MHTTGPGAAAFAAGLVLLVAGTGCGPGGDDTWAGRYAIEEDGERRTFLRVWQEGDQWLGSIRGEDGTWGEEAEGTPASPGDLGDLAVECNARGLVFGGGALLRVDPGCEIADGMVSETGWVITMLFAAKEAYKE